MDPPECKILTNDTVSQNRLNRLNTNKYELWRKLLKILFQSPKRILTPLRQNLQGLGEPFLMIPHDLHSPVVKKLIDFSTKSAVKKGWPEKRFFLFLVFQFFSKIFVEGLYNIKFVIPMQFIYYNFHKKRFQSNMFKKNLRNVCVSVILE